MMKSFVRVGTLKIIDADGKEHVFSGEPGPNVTMRLSDRSLYYKLVFNPELHAGEAYMDGRMSFEDSTLRDFLTLFSLNRLSLGSYPLQKVLRRISRAFRKRQQANPVGKAQQNVAHHYDLGNDFYKLFLDEGLRGQAPHPARPAHFYSAQWPVFTPPLTWRCCSRRWLFGLRLTVSTPWDALGASISDG
jgi:cyclopropane-fatty-acyl-phospholipid synthase